MDELAAAPVEGAAIANMEMFALGITGEMGVFALGITGEEINGAVVLGVTGLAIGE